MPRYTPPREQSYRSKYDRDIARTGDVGNALTSHFVNGITQSDPRQAYHTSANAAFKRFQTRLGENVRQLRGQQAGMGRLDTGFATEDEDRLVTRMGEDLNTELSSRALQAEGLYLDSLNMAGVYGDRFSDRAMAARGGEYHTERSQRMQDEADRRSALGGLISAGISATGTALGGPIGGALVNRFLAPQAKKKVA